MQQTVNTRFAIMVASPAGSAAAALALRFSGAVLRSGGVLEQIFFYHDGVLTLSDQRSVDDWSELATQGDTKLLLCTAAAQRRGLLGHDQPPAGFQVASLAPWLDACLKADRVLRFGPESTIANGDFLADRGRDE